MSRWPLGVLGAYAPHLLEEQVTGMAHDPILDLVLGPLGAVDARASAYLAFQLTFGLGLAMVAAYARGGRLRTLVMGGLALALIAESHHLVRALATLSWNSGLYTAAPLPIVGALLLIALARSARSTPTPARRAV